MFGKIAKEIRALSLALDFVNEDSAKKIVDVINSKVMIKLNAHIIDVFWKSEGEYDSTFLNPFSSRDDESGRSGGARQSVVLKGEGGIRTWAFLNKKTTWIEGIKGISGTVNNGVKTLDNDIKNKPNQETIEKEYLKFTEKTDSIIAIPLTHRRSLWGVYCIELPEYCKFKKEDVKELENIAKAITTIIWKSDVQDQNKIDTEEAIEALSKSISEEASVLEPSRVGFFARPFEDKFESVENYIKKIFNDKRIGLKHYEHPAGAQIVINDIKEKIQKSHFGIVDITGNNPNVMLELGMMMISEKKFIILKNEDDKTELPFDIGSYDYFKYVIKGLDVHIVDPGGGQDKPISESIEKFIELLRRDKTFLNAKEWNELL